MVRFIVSLLLMLLSIVFALFVDGGNPLQIVGVPALIVELLVPTFAMLAVWRLAELRHALRHAFSDTGDVELRARSARIWEFAEKICYAGAVIGAVLGLVIILSAQNLPPEALRRAFGAACVAPLYGVIFGIVCRILRARVQG
jgi:flagellar motor component MotA